MLVVTITETHTEASQAALAAAATRGDPVDSLLASPTTRDHIGRVVVPVIVNGQGPFRFIVDTGANHSTISSALVHTLGLTPSSASVITLDGITGSAQVAFVTVEKIQAGALSIDRTDLPVVWTSVMAGADGILGAAGLTEKTLNIDFQRNRVAFTRSVDAFERGNSTKIRAFPLTRGLLSLKGRVAGIDVIAVIDTGAERTLGNLALRDSLQVRRPGEAVATVTSVYGATQEIETGEIRLVPTIVLDSLRIDNVPIVFGEFHIFRVWGMQDKPTIILGMDVLGTVASLSIDFKNENVYIASVQARSDVLSMMRGYSSDPSQKR